MDCRFYNKELPEIEDVVLVQVKSLSDIGAYVTLLEYGKLEGMIQISEMSNRRIRSISKLTRVGNVEVCLVLRVDADRCYIDLSKKRIGSEDGLKAREAFARAKTVHGIMRHVATITGTDLAAVCQLVSWPLYKEHGPARAYEMLRRMVLEQSIGVISGVCKNLADNVAVAEALMVAASRKLTPHEVRVRALFELTCFSTEGVMGIKDAVAAVKAETTEDALTIKLVSAPVFLIETCGIGKEACVGRIGNALAKLKTQIEARGGNYKLRSPADVIGDDEEEIPKFDEEDASSDDDEESVEKGEDGSESESSSSYSSSSSDSSENEAVPDKRKGKKAGKGGRK